MKMRIKQIQHLSLHILPLLKERKNQKKAFDGDQ